MLQVESLLFGQEMITNLHRLAQPMIEQPAVGVNELEQVGTQRKLATAPGVGTGRRRNLGDAQGDGATSLVEVLSADGPRWDLDLEAAIAATKAARCGSAQCNAPWLHRHAQAALHLLRRPNGSVAGRSRSNDARMGGGSTSWIHAMRTRWRPMRHTGSRVGQGDSAPVDERLAGQDKHKHEGIDNAPQAETPPYGQAPCRS